MVINLKDLEIRSKKSESHSKIVSQSWLPDDYNKIVNESILDISFTPDIFQKQGFYLLSKYENLFVTAHTSSGKTLIVEYAIQLSLANGKKVIYTSPIKALSNQKYHEFNSKFDDVGLLTGDTQINPSAGCLIMTTEILRNMLYNNTNIMRSIDFVIFDEIHYINDSQRGVVWEETIILLPKSITLIMLSATIPNAIEFSDWVGRIKERNVYIISTDKRVVPLEFFLYNDYEIYSMAHLLKYENSKISNLVVKPPPFKSSIELNRKRFRILSLASFVVDKKLVPAIFFVFSRRKSELHGKSLMNLDLTTEEEKKKISKLLEKVCSNINETDRYLPQITEMEKLISRGIAIHHGALLPCVKEIVEILFSQNLIKILIATETFSMGINMPAKSVVLLGLTKMGSEGYSRPLKSSEFIQMSGRAGRRGMDKVGTIIIADSRSTGISQIQNIINAQSSDLISKFKLSFSLILSLKIANLSMEDVLRKSFHENEVQKNIVNDLAKLEKLRERKIAFDCSSCYEMKDFIETLSFISSKNYKLFANQLKIGSIVVSKENMIVEITSIRGNNFYGKKIPLELESNMLFTMEITDSLIDYVSKYNSDLLLFAKTLFSKYPIIYNDTKQVSCLLKPSDILFLVKNRKISFDYNCISLDNISLSIKLSNSFKKLLSYKSLYQSKCFHQHYYDFMEKQKLSFEIAQIEKRCSVENLKMLNEFILRTNFLIEWKFLDKLKIVTLKGRVAAEIKSIDCVFFTDLLFTGFFNNIDCNYIMPLLSGFLCEYSVKDTFITEGLKIFTLAFADRYQIFLDKCDSLNITNNNFLDFSLSQPVLDWINDATLGSIVSKYSCPEGLFVNLISRLDEACKEIIEAIRVMGSHELEELFTNASNTIRKTNSVVFMESLYL